jgi:hypothetical protein
MIELLLLLAVPQRQTIGPIQPPSDITMRAATAQVGTAVEVRLRWRIASNWVPPGGLRLYRTGTAPRLVKQFNSVGDDLVDRSLPADLRGRRLWTSASSSLTVPKLDFQAVRPPSAAQAFSQRKSQVEAIRNRPPAFTPEARRQLAQLHQSAWTSFQRPEVGVALTSVPALSTDVAAVRAARTELHLASALDARVAEEIGLGATDTSARSGETVGYSLVGVDSRGQEIAPPLATIQNFVVGSDPQPPAPTDLVAYQEDDQIFVRWQRPAADAESNLLQVSYWVSRGDPRNPVGIVLNPVGVRTTAKPVVIMSLANGVEPSAFYSERVSQPGPATLRVTLVDGFGRSSSPSTISLNVVEWRKPPTPSEASATLGADFRPGFKMSGGTFGPGGAVLTAPRVTLVWRGGQGGPPGIAYNIYRFDLDQPASGASKLTPSPIPGTALPHETDGQFESVAALLWADRLQRYADAIEAARAEPASTPAEVQARARKVAILTAKQGAILQVLRNSLRDRPALSFIDSTATRDRRFTYFVTSVANGMESEPLEIGNVDIPNPSPPAAVTGASLRFTGIPAPTRNFTSIQQFTRTQAFASNAIGERFAARLQPTRLPVQLTLPPSDHGGTVEVRWNAVPGLKGVTYRILRGAVPDPPPPAGGRLALRPIVLQEVATSEVGVVGPDVTLFRDSLPRSKGRRYRYDVVAYSRWNVKGPAATVTIDVPATLPPETPNLLSARPRGDGEVLLRLESHEFEQGVEQYQILRDGAQIGALPWTNASAGVLEYVDRSATPGRVHSYVVRALTGAGTPSPDSPAVQGGVLKLTAEPPTALAGTSGAQGARLNWTNPAGTSYCVVKRRLGSGPAQVLSGRCEGNTFTDVHALPGKTYTYDVAAVDQAGNVSASRSVPVVVP